MPEFGPVGAYGGQLVRQAQAIIKSELLNIYLNNTLLNNLFVASLVTYFVLRVLISN